MDVAERELDGDLQGTWIEPENPVGLGAVVLGGSSGAVPVERARLLAGVGLRAVALRWFGGLGQSPGICEVPLETIERAIDRLVLAGCTRVSVVGTSKGAEAALLVAALDPRIDLVIAFSPSSVTWANVGPGVDGFEWPLRSSFTWRGQPLPFVPHEAEALLAVGRLPPIRYLSLFERSIEKFADRLTAAAIPIERTNAKVVLVAGGDDQLWPSARFARSLAQRLNAHGKVVNLLIHPHAGHRILLPGEKAQRSKLNEHGGTDEADAALGSDAWSELLSWIG